ncbi:DUF262 domain-containing protein [Halogeometricum sp. CBA1124]|uniref:DUF262 domain-containing protein n=1 Tax=Halogeometricum sp. CBA1124 TaxID=2668071 RepID=UPI0014297992|nr:DUF262 domain-containing protein [Halogeometricum sp. CBA1124]MUV56254.1 DUF262 domain-containing protein [Halogeometricum sp. CBA1124]
MIEEQPAKTKTVREMLPRLNRSLYIPCLQRDYCWSQNQIKMLWDSLLRGLPLGSLLVWNDERDEPRREPAYSFIQHYVDSRSFSFEDHIQRYSQRFGFDELPESYSLVLDGQQRLTSFYISLTGSFTTRKHGGWVSNRGAWNQRELYFDLLSGNQSSEHDRDLVYGFDFRKTGGLSEAGDRYWFPVNRLVDDSEGLSEDSFLGKDVLLREGFSGVSKGMSDDEQTLVKENIERLWWGVNQREAILYEQTLTDEKSARELFIRRNKGGKVLSGVDILLALLTGYWQKVDHEGGPTDAKKQIEQFTKTLSEDTELSQLGFSFGKNFLLRTLLLFSGERPAFRKNGRYDGDDLREAEAVFHDEQFEQAIRDAFKLSSSLGFHNGALSSKNVISPIIQYLYLKDVSTTPSGRQAVHYWLATTVLNGVFGNIGSERVLKTARAHIKESNGDSFPAIEILNDLRGSGAVVELDRDVLDELLDEVDYRSGSRRNVLLTHFYEGRRAGHRKYEVDHIFPRGKLGDEAFLRERNVAPERIDWFKENRDHIANLQLLGPRENQSKSDRDLINWLERIDDGKVESYSNREQYFEQHQVPKDKRLHEYQNYPDFVEHRMEHMKERIGKELPLL